MNALPSLTVFRLRDSLDGKPVDDLREFIDESKKPSVHKLRTGFAFEAMLFVLPPDIRRPPWLDFLEPGFGQLTEIPDSVTNSAALILRVKNGKHDCDFAVTFGFGRYLLRSGSYARNYGIRVALNTVYPKLDRKEDIDPNRLRSVESKTVGSNTVRTRRQTDRRDTFESFAVDIERDLLTGLTGRPLNEAVWGRRITGADAIYLGIPTAFNDLGKLCLRIEKSSKKVPSEFAWVDKIFAVRDLALAEKLRERIVEILKQGAAKNPDFDRLELAPPQLIEWGQISQFGFSLNHDKRFDEPTLAEYLDGLEVADKLDSLLPRHLLAGHRLIAFDDSEAQIHQWPIFSCLSGELKLEKKTFLLSEGEFFEVAERYLTDLDTYISGLKEFAGPFPNYIAKEEEGAYNERAADDSEDRLLLDRKTVRLTSHTSAIEICDILTRERELFHVKRKLNSSSLSHLFSQGLVSADLLLMSDEFRKKTRRVAIAAEKARGMTVGRFSKMLPEDKGVSPSEFTVVYAIMAKWGKKKLVDALPFFSKVNLRRCTQELKRMGYGFQYKRIFEDHA